MTMRSIQVSLFTALAALFIPALVLAQGTPAPTPATEPKAADAASEASPLSSFAWLSGCWRGTANEREFREHWLPLRGHLLVGVGHTVNAGRTQDFEYLRVEPRADGVYYVTAPSGQKEAAFKLGTPQTDGPDTIYTFTNPAQSFPQSIIYRRATGGWLYVHVEGKVGGEDRRIIYPLRRIDCESGDFLAQ